MLVCPKKVDSSPLLVVEASYVNSSLYFLVTSQCRHILSKGHSFLRAVCCMMAVRSDCGLNKPPSQTDDGNCVTYTHIYVSRVIGGRIYMLPLSLSSSLTHVKIHRPIRELACAIEYVREPIRQSKSGGISEFRPRRRHGFHKQVILQILHVRADRELALKRLVRFLSVNRLILDPSITGSFPRIKFIHLQTEIQLLQGSL